MDGPAADANGTVLTAVPPAVVAYLQDAITESVASPADPEARAEAIVEILRYTVEAVRWRLEPLGDPVEERSAERILEAALEHLGRMRGTAPPAI